MKALLLIITVVAAALLLNGANQLHHNTLEEVLVSVPDDPPPALPSDSPLAPPSVSAVPHSAKSDKADVLPLPPKPTLDRRPPPATPHPAIKAQAEALRLYPALGKKDSPMNRAFLIAYGETRRTDPELLSSPNWPLPAWIIAGVAALLCIPGALWWAVERSRLLPAEVLPVRENAPAPVKAADSEEAPPFIDERDAPRVERAGVDASNFYEDAFALYGQLTDEEKEMMRHPSEEVDVEKADALFAKIQPIMELLRRGAAADYCDWGLKPFEPDTQLPHLGKSQNLGAMALWNAAYRFPSDPEGAIDDLAARAKLGHDVADILIGWLAESSFEKSSTKLLLENAASLSDEARTKAHDFLRSSTLDSDMERAMSGEMQFSRSMFEKLAAQRPEERPTFSQLTGSQDYSAVSEEDRKLDSLIRDTAWLEAESRLVQKFQTQMAEAMFWPDARYNEWTQQFDAAFTAAHPLARSAVAFSEVRSRFQVAASSAK